MQPLEVSYMQEIRKSSQEPRLTLVSVEKAVFKPSRHQRQTGDKTNPAESAEKRPTRQLGFI